VANRRGGGVGEVSRAACLATDGNGYYGAMTPPTVFLSSTIHDFKDLRSALKYYLEEQGCVVLASEYNDFLKPLDIHSYEACLQAINRANYFILLIGTRIGGWFDLRSHISITQQEYRHAYELQKAGKIKILTFVRAEVWQLREERKELAAYLSSLPYSEAEKKRLSSYPSKFAEDAGFIAAFISEVSRAKETLAALSSSTAFPTGNWIHVFHDFREVVATIQAQLFSGLPVAVAAFRRLLLSETREFVRKCIPKSRGKLFPPRRALEAFLLKYPLTLESRDEAERVIDGKDWDTLTWYAYHLLGLNLHPVILDEAIISPFFLRFDVQLSAFEETEVYRAICMLKEEIRKLTQSNTTETLSVVFEHSPRSRAYRSSPVTVDTKKLVMLIHLYDRWVNVIDLSAAIYAYLDGHEFKMPQVRSRSPIQGMEQEIDAESPTMADTMEFLRSHYCGPQNQS
jgi:hypothetical protein